MVRKNESSDSISTQGKDHITIAYSEKLFRDIDALSSMPQSVEFRVTGSAMFGEKNDVPVYTVEFMQEVPKKLAESYRARYQNSQMHDTYRPHISKKHVTAKLEPGDLLLATRVFIAEAGEKKSDDVPIYEFRLLHGDLWDD